MILPLDKTSMCLGLRMVQGVSKMLLAMRRHSSTLESGTAGETTQYQYDRLGQFTKRLLTKLQKANTWNLVPFYLCYAFATCAFIYVEANAATVQSATYNGVTNGMYAGTAPIKSGVVQTTAQLDIAGRSVTVPASAKLAANAAAYATSKIRNTTPEILGPNVLLWLSASNIQVKNGQYVVPGAASQAYLGWDWARTLPWAIPVCDQRSGWRIHNENDRYYYVWYFGGTSPPQPNMYFYGSCVWGPNIYRSLRLDRLQPLPDAPLTDAEWNRLANSTLPDSAASELAAPPSYNPDGLPIETPTIGPTDIAIGPPYQKPDGTWWQERAQIASNPDGSVSVDTYEGPASDVSGLPVTNHVLVKNEGPPDPTSCIGNPINAGTANKYQAETDYRARGAFPLELARHYNSQSTLSGELGANWTAFAKLTNIGANSLNAQRPSGRILSFNLLNGLWQPDADITDQIEKLADGRWRYTASDDSVETYNAGGKLQQVSNRAGLS